MWQSHSYQAFLRALCLCILAPTIGHSTSSFSRGLGVTRQGLPEASRSRRLQGSSGLACAKSWLGYQCTALACGRIRIHWSLGGDPPLGPGCSYGLNTTQAAAAPDPSSQLLHVALQTDLTGYLALSWPRMAGWMFPADAVIGFIDMDTGKPHVAAYRVTGKSPAEVVEDSNIDITNTGLEKNATALTICFTRNISQVGSAAGINIKAQTAVDMNFAASSAAFSAMHRLSGDYTCGTKLTLYQSVTGPDDGGWRPSNVTADADTVMAERLSYMRAHGALQFTGWLVLVPIGVLAARHRWIFAPANVAGLWFQVHRVVQMVAVVLITAGFVLPWTSFDSNDEEAVMGVNHGSRMASDMLLEAHQSLAIALMAALGLHVVIAALRPKPDAPRRWVWNLVHWWTGRGLAVLAGVNIAIGIALWRRVSGGSGAEWIIPAVLFGAGWAGVAVWMERRAPEGLGREGGPAGGSVNGGLTAGFVQSSSPESSPVKGVPLSRLPGTQMQLSNGAGYTKL